MSYTCRQALSLILLLVAGLALAAPAPAAAPEGESQRMKYTERDRQGRVTRVYTGFPTANGQVVLDGVEVFYGPDGQRQRGAQYRHGRKDGPCKTWYPSGQVAEEGAYANDRKDGLWTRYSETGQKLSEGRYERDVKQGVFRSWYPDGKPKLLVTYANDRRSGPATRWRPDGSCEEEANYRDDQLDGLRIVYDQAGRKRQETTYAADRQHGPETEFRPDGTVAARRSFAAGKLQGLEITYYPDGRLQCETPWRGDLKDGTEKQWYSNGKPMSQVDYRNGKRDGSCQEWTLNGQLHLSCHYRDDQLEGEYKAWREDGSLASDGTCRNDRPYTGRFLEPGLLANQYYLNQYDKGECSDDMLFENGSPKTGTMQEHLVSGGIARTYELKDGRRHGLELIYYPNRQKQRECTWNQNKLNGLVTEWFPNGQVKSQVEMANGVPQGRELHWNERGVKLAEGTNRDGKPWDGVLPIEVELKTKVAVIGKILVKSNGIQGPPPKFELPEPVRLQAFQRFKDGKPVGARIPANQGN